MVIIVGTLVRLSSQGRGICWSILGDEEEGRGGPMRRTRLHPHVLSAVLVGDTCVLVVGGEGGGWFTPAAFL